MRHSSTARLGLASLLGALAVLATPAAGAAPTCTRDAARCTTGTASLKAAITTPIPTSIDSGWMEKGPIKVRARFSIDPKGTDPLVQIDMPRGAVVEASWDEPGYVTVRPVSGEGATGTINVRYTLTPSLEAGLYGVNIAYDATQLVNKIPGARFNYDSKGSGTLVPWGFAGGEVATPKPALETSTVFSIPFSQLGVGTNIAEGTLSLQAAANPTFKFVTKQVRFDAETVTSEGASVKVPVGDNDAIDLVASIGGEISLAGNLDIRPVVKVDSVKGFSTFGFVKFGFNAVSRPIAVAPTTVAFEAQTIHIGLPNVKAPPRPVALGAVKAGGSAKKTVAIENTGELEARFTVTSSDPQFVVAGEEFRIAPKSTFDLPIAFKPSSDGPTSAKITVKSNDPDSPEQTFLIGANGADIGADADDDEESAGSGRKKNKYNELDGEPPSLSDEGCSVVSIGGRSGDTSLLALGAAAVGVTVARRRRRRA